MSKREDKLARQRSKCGYLREEIRCKWVKTCHWVSPECVAVGIDPQNSTAMSHGLQSNDTKGASSGASGSLETIYIWILLFMPLLKWLRKVYR